MQPACVLGKRQEPIVRSAKPAPSGPKHNDGIHLHAVGNPERRPEHLGQLHVA